MVITTRGYLGRRALLAAIDGYRRWLSGRGPLRRVRCTFHHGETCSAYGRRIAAEAEGLGPALGRIRRRLHRCADAALYALPEDVLGWGPAYDRPLASWQGELERDRELPATRAALMGARTAVARWRGDRRELHALATLAPAAGPRLIVRRTDTTAGVRVAALARPLAIAAVVVILAALVLPLAITLAVAAVAAWPIAGRAGRLRGRRRRLRWQATAAAIARG